MQRRLTLHPSLVVLLLLGVVLAAPCAPACAQTVTPAAEQQPAPFAYAAPALIQELDTKYPFPPPVPHHPHVRGASCTSLPVCYGPSTPPPSGMGQRWP